MPPRTTASEQDFWNRMLSAAKVKRILEKRGFSPDAFRDDYLADNSRAPRSSNRPTNKEIDAVTRYHKDWDVKALMSRLDVKTKASALTVVDRVMRWQSRTGERKVMRRPAAERGNSSHVSRDH